MNAKKDNVYLGKFPWKNEYQILGRNETYKCTYKLSFKAIVGIESSELLKFYDWLNRSVCYKMQSVFLYRFRRKKAKYQNNIVLIKTYMYVIKKYTMFKKLSSLWRVPQSRCSVHPKGWETLHHWKCLNWFE